MKPPVERFKLSEVAKYQLITIKKRTKIETWNVICRWAFCYSLAQEHPPSPVPIPADSNVEMTWQTFGGSMSEILIIALKQWCQNQGFDPTDEEVLAKQFRWHLHRGIGYISGDPHIRSIDDLMKLVVPKTMPELGILIATFNLPQFVNFKSNWPCSKETFEQIKASLAESMEQTTEGAFEGDRGSVYLEFHSTQSPLDAEQILIDIENAFKN